MAANPLQTFIGKGILSWKPTAGSYRDVGEAPVFRLSPSFETKDYTSSRGGVGAVVRTVLVKKALTLTVQMDEITKENLALFFLGEENSAGLVNMMTLGELTGSFKCVGTNDVGAKFTVEAAICSITPSGDFDFISEDWGGITFTVAVSADPDTGEFFTVTETEAAF